jgi:uncharacterized repeat protein (TIGR01451 family)
MKKRESAALLAALMIAALIAIAEPAHAIGFTINTFSDGKDVHPGDSHCDSNAGASGDQCTLRAAIMEANAKHDNSASMHLPPGTYTLTIPPSGGDDDAASGDLDLKTNIGFYGTEGRTIIKGGTNFHDRIFDIPSGSPNVTLHGVVVTGGEAPGTQGGGGVRDLGAKTLYLQFATIKGNTAGGPGGGVYVKTGSGTAVVTNIVTLSGNHAGGNGGGLDVEGGVIATLNRLTVTGNSATNGGGVAAFVTSGSTGSASFAYKGVVSNNTASNAGGGLDVGRTDATGMTITGNSASVGGGLQLVGSGKASSISGRNTIANNDATNSGGGIFTSSCEATCGVVFNTNLTGNTAKDGSGVYANGTVTLSSVSVYQNTATGGGRGGAIYHAGSAGNPLHLVNVTVNANKGGPVSSGVLLASSSVDDLTNLTIDANTGSGINGVAVLPPSPAPTVRNSILSGATTNCVGSIKSLGNNLDTGNSCHFSLGSDLHDRAPNFMDGVARDAGGFTKTRPLKSNSPAVDGGSSTGCPLTDARAVLRPEGSKCDMGAYEVSPGTRNSDIQINGLQATPSSARKGTTVTFTMSVLNHGPLPSFKTFLVDRLPDQLSYKSCSTKPKGSCSVSNGVVTVTWSSGLGVGAKQTVTIVATIKSTTTAGSIKNTLWAYSNNPDHYPTSNVATSTVNVTS